MLTNMLTMLSIQISKRLNGLLYFSKKVPGLKKIFKNKDYSFPRLKKILSIIAILYKLISSPINTAIIFFLAIYLPSSSVAKGDITSSIMLLIVSFYFIIPLFNSTTIQVEQEKFIMVKQMRMHPKDYSLAKITLDSLLDVWSEIVLLGLVFKFILGLDFILGVNIAISSVTFSIFVEAIHLYMHKKSGFSINNKTVIQITSYIVVLLATYALVIFTYIPEKLNILSFFQYDLTMPLFLLLGIFGYVYMLRYEKYWDIINEKNTVDTFQNLNKIMGESNFADVKLKDKDYDDKSLDSKSSIDKEGYDYLNYIFFSRHKRIVYKPMIIKTLIVTAIFLALFIMDRFFIDGVGVKVSNAIIDKYTVIIIIIYIICNSEKLIRSMFYNCDRSMLRYGFYKRGNALLNMFFLRLRKIIYSNSLPILILMIGIYTATSIYAPMRIAETIPILISIVFLSLFFSVHYIFMYYIFQPFSDSLRIKNPFYSIINFIVYLVSYIFLKIELSSKIILPVIVLFSVVYIILAIILIYKKGPKTFRIK